MGRAENSSAETDSFSNRLFEAEVRDTNKKIIQAKMQHMIYDKIVALCPDDNKRFSAAVPPDKIGIDFASFTNELPDDSNLTISVSHGEENPDDFGVIVESLGEGRLDLKPVQSQALGSDISGIGFGIFQEFSNEFGNLQDTTSLKRLEITHKLVTALGEAFAKPV